MQYNTRTSRAHLLISITAQVSQWETVQTYSRQEAGLSAQLTAAVVDVSQTIITVIIIVVVVVIITATRCRISVTTWRQLLPSDSGHWQQPSAVQLLLTVSKPAWKCCIHQPETCNINVMYHYHQWFHTTSLPVKYCSDNPNNPQSLPYGAGCVCHLALWSECSQSLGSIFSSLTQIHESVDLLHSSLRSRSFWSCSKCSQSRLRTFGATDAMPDSSCLHKYIFSSQFLGIYYKFVRKHTYRHSWMSPLLWTSMAA